MVQRLRDYLAARGHSVTYDWTQQGQVRGTADDLRQIAMNEIHLGVQRADAVVVLLPGRKGTHTELWNCHSVREKNVDKSVEWYVRIFRMEVVEADKEFAGLTFPQGEALVLLCKVEKPQPTVFEISPGKKAPYFNFESFDIEASNRELKALGVQVSEIHPEVDFRYFDCYDPDGNPLSIVEDLEQSLYYPHKQRYKDFHQN